jgi:hypothetical protein
MKKPFIFDLAISYPIEHSINEYIEYSDQLNLNVLKGTNSPAIGILNLDGETFTRDDNDRTEHCRNNISKIIHLLSGQTITESREATDATHNKISHLLSLLSDKKSGLNNLLDCIEGETNTRQNQESTDSK